MTPTEWISVKDRLPPIKWSEPDEEGKSYFGSIPVLLLRKITCHDGETFNSIVVGEHDTSCIPDRWVICYYTVSDEYGLESKNVEIEDVTHWMPLPEMSNE